MAVRVGINGFGRIGRQSLRAILERWSDDVDVVAVNDITDNDSLAHLFKYDSNYGRYPGPVAATGDKLVINGNEIRALEEPDPSKLPWSDLGVDIVIESTGIFRDGPKARMHLDAGAKKVLITAPAKEIDCTLVLGVNENAYDPARHRLISNASCTTNCLAPIVKVLHEEFGIERGLMTTIHSYTNDQRILDLPHKDRRRMRAAALNMIPTTTGAAKAIGLVVPELDGRLDGFAIRVPTPTVSIVDLTVNVQRAADVDAVNAAMRKWAEGPMKGILGYEEEDLVSMDFKGDDRSSIFDPGCTRVIDKTLIKVTSWYDNEWGYSARVADLVKFIGDKGL
ncbi:MAG: type I glyceraldehyde-3-phosphate dehydrogenase [Armatimonadota bacterium]